MCIILKDQIKLKKAGRFTVSSYWTLLSRIECCDCGETPVVVVMEMVLQVEAGLNNQSM
jgi:hypothetical protein